MKKITLASVFMLLVLPALSSAQTTQSSLRGLRGIFINVPPLEKDAEADGLSVSQIQRIVESELRRAGILIQKEARLSQEYAALLINIQTSKHPRGDYVFSVRVSVIQEVQILRPQMRGTFAAETYGSSLTLGLTNPSRMDIIYEALEGRLKEFIIDYLAANLKQ